VAFVASTYMRGVKFVLVPTTLLGQVDAAIGGKCAINMGGYKNMVGLFSLPNDVVCDAAWLATLPKREWRAGMAEVIKTAIIGDEELFEILEQKGLEEVRQDVALVEEIVARCVAVKCGIVQRDLCESGERRLLNLGHTFDHAIESLSGEYSHGEAVAVGLVLAARKAVEMGVLDESTATRIVALVERYGLPTSVDIPTEELLPAILHDKKMQGGSIHWILPTRIGECIVKKEELL
jgi:3-dehydroquinate synthase